MINVFYFYTSFYLSLIVSQFPIRKLKSQICNWIVFFYSNKWSGVIYLRFMNCHMNMNRKWIGHSQFICYFKHFRGDLTIFVISRKDITGILKSSWNLYRTKKFWESLNNSYGALECHQRNWFKFESVEEHSFLNNRSKSKLFLVLSLELFTWQTTAIFLANLHESKSSVFLFRAGMCTLRISLELLYFVISFMPR